MRARKKGVVGLVIAIALMMVLLAGMLYFSYAGDSYNVDNALTGAAIGLEVENNLTKSTNSLEIIIDPISGGNVLGPDLENDPVIILPITNETSNNPLPLNDTIIVLPIVNETNNPDNNLNQSPVLDSNYTIVVPPEPADNQTNEANETAPPTEDLPRIVINATPDFPQLAVNNTNKTVPHLNQTNHTLPNLQLPRNITFNNTNQTIYGPKYVNITDIELFNFGDEDVVRWNKTFNANDGNDRALAAAFDSQDNIFVAGQGNNLVRSDSGNDWWMKKFYGQNGSEDTSQWNKTFDGEEVDEMGRSVQQTSDGGYFIVGITTSYGASPYTAKELGQVAPQDIYLIKTDANGNKVWKKVFGGTRIDMAFSGQQTSDGGYIVAGLTASWSGKKDIYRKASGALAVEDEGYIYAECIGGHIDNERELPCAEDMYLLKIDADGNKVWEKTFGMKNNRSDAGYSIQQTSDGGYIIVGQTFWHVLDSEGAISWNDARSDVYLVKTDANGNVIWEKTFGRNSSDFGYSVQQTTDGGYIVSGFTTTPFESFESLLAKYEKLGIEKPFEKVIEKDIEKSKLPAGGRIKPYLIKTDSNGNKIWERIFEDGFGRDWTWTTTWPGGMNSVRQTSDGGYIIAAGNKHTHDIPRGPTEPTPLTMGEGYDAYIIKTDANGNR